MKKAAPLHPPLPAAFVKNMHTQWGEEADALLGALEGPRPHALRLSAHMQKERLPFDAKPVPWEPLGCYYEQEDRPGAHVLHEAGAYYIQDASAMTAARVLDPQPNERILDLCAAPGGKSTHIASLMQNKGLLVSNELIGTRAKILSRNIERMGITHALVTQETPAKLAERFTGYFDRVLVDTPCSGEGMFGKTPMARLEWTADAPLQCAQRSREILRSAREMVREGGVLVYSTCTFNDVENEGVVQGFLQEFEDFTLEAFELDGLPAATDGMMHMLPNRLKGEGHFVAKLRRMGEVAVAVAPTHQTQKIAAWEDFAAKYAIVIQTPIVCFGDTVWALPKDSPILDGLHIVRAGLLLGEERKGHFVPDHALARALLTIPNALPNIPLSLEEAIAYLQGEVLPCEDGMSGYHVVTYEQLPLGFVKCVQGQAKNHYPKGLRK